MITFHSITYKNFKSIGNSPITISLDKTNTTLVTGKNGSGKSTLTSVICFALFGQDFVLNKPGLINSINRKNLEVTIEFSVGNNVYKVHRGVKPNIFKIYKDSVILNEDSSTRDYQKILESQILKMDIRAFKQVVVVGGRAYVPFMKLKPNERREFIEDLLDIRIFSTMSSLLKEKAKAVKEDLRGIGEELKTITEKVKLQETFIKKLTSEKNVSIDKIEDGIKVLETENEGLSLTSAAYLDIEKSKLLQLKQYDHVISEMAALSQEKLTLNISRNNHAGSIDFYAKTSVCPKCTQPIANEHREHIVKSARLEVHMCDTNLKDVQDKLVNLQTLVAEQTRTQKEISTIQEDISATQNKMYSNMVMIKKARVQIEEMKTDTRSIDSEKEKQKEFAKTYVALDNRKKEIMESQQYQDFVIQVLTDGGIKTKIIKQYIPTINKLINKYLSALDFFVAFHLDENFDETIKSRHRDTFKYDNFSDGQAARIDLALMFAWRDIAKMRNAVNTNLLFLDEADAAVDIDGASMLSELLNSVEKSNIFVISHKGDLLRDKFDRTITFDIKNNFTVISDT